MGKIEELQISFNFQCVHFCKTNSASMRGSNSCVMKDEKKERARRENHDPLNPTRNPAFYDPTFYYLTDRGIPVI
jgi:hypothetical protein